MAPRRLVTAMLILLAVSTAFALLLPEPPPPTERGQTDSRPTPDRQPPPGSTPRVEETSPGGGTDDRPEPKEERRSTSGLPVRTLMIPAVRPPRTVPVVSDRPLTLEVASRRFRTIAIPNLGLTDVSDRYSPAVFDLLPADEPKKIEVIEVETGRTVTTLQVRG